MNPKQIISSFKQNGLYLRPMSLNLLKQELSAKDKESQSEFVKKVIDLIQSILMNRNQLIGQCFVEPDLMKEALNLGQYDQVEEKRSDDVTSEFMIILDNFTAEQEVFDSMSKKMKTIVTSINKESDFHRHKFTLLRHLLDKSEFTYNRNERGKCLLNEIGSLKGQKGSFSIFGLIYSSKGNHYLEDGENAIKLLTSNCKLSIGYICVGSFVVAKGEMLDRVFKVDEFVLPELRSEVNLVREAQYVTALLDKHGETKTKKDSFSTQIINMSSYLREYDEGSYITVLSNFNLKEENLKLLKKLLERFRISKPAGLFIAGRFTDLVDLENIQQKNQIKTAVEAFLKLLLDYKDVTDTLDIYLVPDINDLGAETFPRDILLYSPYRRLVEEVPSLHLLQNPSKFRFCGNNFVISRANFINKLVRGSVVPVSIEVQPLEHFTRTLLSQRDLLPGHFSDLTGLNRFRGGCLLHTLPDFLLICDDFLPAFDIDLAEKRKAVFVPNFSNSGGYVNIYPARKAIEHKQINPN